MTQLEVCSLVRLAELWVVNRDLKASDFPSIFRLDLLVAGFVDDSASLEDPEGPATSGQKRKKGYIKNMSPPRHPSRSVFKFELKTSLWFAFTLHMMSQECFYKRILASSHHGDSIH